METKKLKSLDLNKLQSKNSVIISSKESLKDVTPINWNNKVLAGERKITINCNL